MQEKFLAFIYPFTRGKLARAISFRINDIRMERRWDEYCRKMGIEYGYGNED